MGKNDGVDITWRNRQSRPIPKSQGLVTLEQSTIDKDAPFILLQQVLGPGHRSGTAQKCQF